PGVAATLAGMVGVSLLAYAGLAQRGRSKPTVAASTGTGAVCDMPMGTPGAHGMPPPETASVADAGPVEPTVVENGPPPGPAPRGMVWVPPGRFSMGSAYEPFADARPIHTVELDGFWMDATPVTNEEFARFVQSTGYVTVAERRPDPKQFPGASPDQLVPGALVFTPPPGSVPLDDVSAW